MIKGRGGRRLHVIEAGDGVPVVFLHGSGTSALSALSLVEHLQGIRIIAFDRPGYGFSDPVEVPRERFREAAIEFLDESVDELGLESFALAGGSMGGTWALWYALAYPERVRGLALLGSAPLLPGARPPTPLRVMAAPVVGDVLPRLVKPSAKMVVRLMSSMGEGETIVRHPDLIDAIVAAGRDPIAAATDLAELGAILTPLRFRRSLRVQPGELKNLTVPTLMIWGDHDPVGTVKRGASRHELDFRRATRRGRRGSRRLARRPQTDNRTLVRVRTRAKRQMTHAPRGAHPTNLRSLCHRTARAPEAAAVPRDDSSLPASSTAAWRRTR